MKKALIIIGVLVLIFMAIQYSRADYLTFKQQREDWHKRCDAYVGSAATLKDPAKEKACNEELAQMLAYAKRKGWLE